MFLQHHILNKKKKKRTVICFETKELCLLLQPSLLLGLRARFLLNSFKKKNKKVEDKKQALGSSFF